MPRIELENLWKTFRDGRRRGVPAVQELNLTIEDSEFLVLAGPSGCGKTTLLRLVAGLETPEAGTIRFDGQVVNNLPAEDRDVALLFQDHALFPQLTVYDNLALGLRLRGVTLDERHRRVLQTAEPLGLTPLLPRYPETLSGGERQRVALGRALARRPKVLLLDEPLSNLDLPLRAQVREEILRWHRELRVTTLYVTHDQGEPFPVGHRLAVMRGGAIQQVADPLMVYQQPQSLFVASFLGSPPMQFLEGKFQQREGQLFFVTTPAEDVVLPAPAAADPEPRKWSERPAVAGIRPEDIRVLPGRAQPPQAPARAGIVERVDFSLVGLFLTIRVGPCFLLTARLPGVLPVRPGDPVWLQVDPSRVHWFDPASGRRLFSSTTSLGTTPAPPQ